jgi:tRNA nucleotidyltransferase (CCA-adding enzyme)
MKTYVVGGAVRDRLLGLPVSDRDHVVVGATVDEMIAAGFKPVGRDFPVFLHPDTHEEYALARTERKVARGYAGFVFHADPSVSLEADLERRDLTINAIAEDEASGELIDPFGGRRDLEGRVFRHVGPAFVEDPVRALRVARFAARFVDFEVAPETLLLMQTMAANGEIDALVPERVWQEISRGLMERSPSRMIEVMRAADMWSHLLPELKRLSVATAGAGTLAALDRAARKGAPLEVRFAILLDELDVATEGAAALASLAARLAIPRAVRDLAGLAIRHRTTLLGMAGLSADAFVTVMEDSDAFRRPARFDRLVESIGLGLGDDQRRRDFAARVAAAAAAARTVEAAAIARAVDYDPQAIATRLHATRVAAVAAAI